MNTKSKATVATIGLGALVLSGGTLALWQDQAELDDATISTGHLKVTAGDQHVYDISALKLSDTHSGTTAKSMEEGDDLAPDEIKLAEYKATPGDILRVVQKLDVELEGHNLLARLEITDPVTGENLLVDSDDGDEFGISRAWLVTADDPKSAAVLHNDYSKPWDTVGDDYEYRFTKLDNGKPLYVVYTVTFDDYDQVDPIDGRPDPEDTEPDAPAMNASATISGLGVTLTQIRHTDETVEP